MPRHARQCVTGIVVNDRCNTGRTTFDTLKAILHNCAVNGPAAQNRDNVRDFRGHLAGRIAWIAQVNPRRGAKLWYLFDRIEWSSTTRDDGAAQR
jgi:RNA-directed DNA polymerase